MLSGGWVSGWVEDRMSQNPATMRVPELIVRRRGRKFKSCRIDDEKGYRKVSFFRCRYNNKCTCGLMRSERFGRRGCGRPVDDPREARSTDRAGRRDRKFSS